MSLTEVKNLSVQKVKEKVAVSLAGQFNHRTQSKSVFYDGGITNLHVGTLKFDRDP
jgi:hypothetical protein